MELSLNSRWICFHERTGEYDVLPVVSSHIETVVMLQKKNKNIYETEV